MLFAITTGFTASGIAANLYRISGATASTGTGQTLRLAVMAIAGPSVIFEYAVRGYNAKEWNPLLFWIVVALVTYWSLALGLFVLDVALHL
jgi:hypothetical protein